MGRKLKKKGDGSIPIPTEEGKVVRKKRLNEMVGSGEKRGKRRPKSMHQRYATTQIPLAGFITLVIAGLIALLILFGS